MHTRDRSTHHYRAVSAGHLDIHLTSLEILLDIAERQSNAGAAFRRIAREYALIQQDSLADLPPAELESFRERVTVIDRRVMRLAGAGTSKLTERD